MQSQIKLRFSVSDTGIGISEHDQAKLFQPFSQVDTSITRRFGGTGLGLAISHNLLSMMGSDLHVDSVLGQGTTFSFELLLGVTNADSLSIVTRSQGQLKADALSTRMRESAVSG
jgi:signal transduction histidine kinase